MKRLSGLLIGALFALLTVAAWGFREPADRRNRRGRAASRGFAFQPYQKDQDAVRGDLPTLEQIESGPQAAVGQDPRGPHVQHDRHTGADSGDGREHDIAVTIGAWLNHDRAANEREVESAIRLAHLNRNVSRVIVGNEVLLRGDMAFEDLVAEIERVRTAVKQPVSTAEPWNIWLENPELAQHVDFITVHMLPYWEGIEVQSAVDHVMARMKDLQARFPTSRS
jgi:hypothetical protein